MNVDSAHFSKLYLTASGSLDGFACVEQFICDLSVLRKQHQPSLAYLVPNGIYANPSSVYKSNGFRASVLLAFCVHCTGCWKNKCLTKRAFLKIDFFSLSNHEVYRTAVQPLLKCIIEVPFSWITLRSTLLSDPPGSEYETKSFLQDNGLLCLRPGWERGAPRPSVEGGPCHIQCSSGRNDVIVWEHLQWSQAGYNTQRSAQKGSERPQTSQSCAFLFSFACF